MKTKNMTPTEYCQFVIDKIEGVTKASGRWRFKEWEKQLIAQARASLTYGERELHLHPRLWASDLHTLLMMGLSRSQVIDGVYTNSYVIKDGQLSLTYGLLYERYVKPGAIALMADIVDGTPRKDVKPLEGPDGHGHCVAVAESEYSGLSVTVGMAYDSKSAGTRVHFTVEKFAESV